MNRGVPLLPLKDELVPLTSLLLDPNNYRFQDASGFAAASPNRFQEESVQRRAYERTKASGIAELKNSILTNGFLPFEKIIVKPYMARGNGTESYLVVEGNRRVAALRWIAEDYEAGVDVRPDLLEVIKNVPVIVIEKEAEDADPALTLSLMGVRHVGGIREWGGYQRAKLVSQLRDLHNLDVGEVASRLGLTAHEVNRRYRAFKALQQMMSDEEFSDQAEPDMYPFFHEAVGGTVLKEWLEWDDDRAEFLAIDNLHQFYRLITSSEDGDGNVVPPKLPTREAVRELRDILPVPEARRALFDSDQSFHDALAIAKADALSKTWASHIDEAVAALKSVGALELRRLSSDDLAALYSLRDLTNELLGLYERVRE